MLASGPEMPNVTGDTTLEGVVEDVVYQSQDGFAVVRLSVGDGDDGGEPVTATGNLGSVRVGERLRLGGRFSSHPRYGPQFQARTATLVPPTSSDGIVRYLGSGLIKGVRERTAKKIVDSLGPDALERICAEPDALRSVPGLGQKRAGEIVRLVRSRRDEADVLSFLQGHDVGPAIARRILKRFGADTVRIVRSDPYRLAEEVSGVGFLRADRIARALGIPPGDPRRAAAAVLHVLAKASEEGHCFLSSEDLLQRSAALEVDRDAARDAIPRLGERGHVVVEDEAIFAVGLHAAEMRLAASLRALATSRVARPGAAERSEQIAGELGLSPTQRKALRSTLEAGLVVLTGGPGTGKTTTLRAVVRLFESLGQRVLLSAPTGRAAKRMSEATGRSALTIHRLLEWIPKEARFRRNRETPLDGDLFVIDEASMLDVSLADQLLDAIPPSASLLLVGDVDQLPSVGPGSVLGDVISSGVARVVSLSEIFRQAALSGIVQNAHRVDRGEMIVSSPDAKGDFHFVRVEEPGRIVRLIAEAATSRIPRAFGLHAVTDIQVLCPMIRGDVGVERLNEVLQGELNPGGQAGPGVFRTGDKVMQLRNDYDRDVFNGDLGVVRRVAPGEVFVDVDGREVIYEADDLGDLTLAYACTIHKAQGSEFPATVIGLSTQHWVLLGRNLLYTAITRARRLCVVIGSARAVRRAVSQAGTRLRHTRLGDRLAGRRAATWGSIRET